MVEQPTVRLSPTSDPAAGARLQDLAREGWVGTKQGIPPLLAYSNDFSAGTLITINLVRFLDLQYRLETLTLFFKGKQLVGRYLCICIFTLILHSNYTLSNT